MPRKDAPTPEAEESPTIDLRALFGAMSDAVLVLNREGRWLWAAPTLAYQSPRNRKRLEFLIGKTFHEVEPGQADKLLAVVHAALDTGQTQQVEYEVNRDDHKLWFAAAVSPIDDDRVVWVARNVTELVRSRRVLEDRVEERTRDLETLLDVSRTVASTLDLREVIGRLLDQAKLLVPYNGASVNLLEGDELVVLDARAPKNDYKIGARFPVTTRDKGSPKGMWQRLTRGEVVIIKDMFDLTDTMAVSYTRTTIAAGEQAVEALNRIRAWMAVPLINQGEILGALTMSRPEPDFFTEEHARLAMAVAGQAAVAIQNARLFEQTQRRERELAALLEVSGTLASTLDAGEVLGAIVDQLSAITEHTGASVLLIRDDAFEFVEARSMTGARAETGARIPFDVAPALSKALRRGDTVIIDDIKADEPLAVDYRAAIGSLGLLDEPPFNVIRSWMAVPLALKDRVLGVLTISWTKPSYFTENHARLAKAFAGQAAIAIENARLFEQKEERTRELSVLLDVSRELSAMRDLRSLARAMLEQIKRVIDFTGGSAVAVEGDTMRIIQSIGPGGPEDALENVRLPLDRSMALPNAVMSGEPVIIENVRGEGQMASDYRAILGPAIEQLEYNYIRGWMAIPLNLEGRVVGFISLSKDVPNYFTEHHVELATAIARHAAVAADNATLLEQTQRRSRELGALFEISRALSSTLELQPLLELMLDQLRLLVHYEGAGISLITGDTMVQLAVRRPEKYHDMPGSGPTTTEETFGPVWDRLSQGETISIDDVLDDSLAAQLFRRSWGGDLRGTAVEYIRSMIIVPLITRDEVIGTLNLAHSEPAHFKDEHVELVKAVAAPAAAAIANARLFEQTQRRSRELGALFEVSRALSSTLELQPLMELMLDELKGVVGYDGAGILLAVEGGLRQFAVRRPKEYETMPQDEEVERLWERGGPAWNRAALGKPVIVDDVLGATAPATNFRNAWGGGDLKETPTGYARSLLSVPLMSRDELIGAITLGHAQPGYYTKAHVELIQTVAGPAAAAIENARLYQQATRLAAVEERQRLARELHDSVSQALYGIALGARTARTVLDRDPVKAIEPVDYVLSLAEAGLAEMRALIFELRPESLETEGIVAALNKQIAATAARYEIAITANLCDEPDVSLDRKEVLYRIAQEALHNTVKHARASSVNVTLAQANGRLTLTVSDNGVGFDPSGDFPGHLGLKSMRERAAQAGGDVRIESAPGAGATVSAAVPAQ